MASNPPISFAALAQTAANPAVGGYPYQLKGSDMDECFTYATADYDDAHFAVTTGLGAGGHKKRKVSLANPLPDLPETGTYVLGVVDGVLEWIATEQC